MYNNNTVFGHYAASRLELETLYSGPTSQNFYRNFEGERALNGINSLYRKGPDLKLTRNSIGTFINSGGVISYAQPNVARFEWGTDYGFRGLLIEEGRTNIIYYSEDFVGGLNLAQGWAAENVTLTPNSTISPDFNNTATLINASPSTGFRGILHSPIPDFLNVTNLYSRSIYVKQNVGRYLAFCISDPSEYYVSQVVRIFDFQTNDWVRFGPGGVLGDSNPTKNNNELPIQVLQNGWIRVAIVNEPSNENADKFFIGMAATSAWQSAQFTSTGNLGSFYVWGGQYEEGDFPSSYIPTTGQPRLRAADRISTASLSGLFNHKESSFFIKGDRINVNLQGAFGSFTQGASQYFQLLGLDSTVVQTGQGAVFKNNLNTTQIVLSSILPGGDLNESDTTYTMMMGISSNLTNLTQFYYAQDQTFVGQTTSVSVIPVLGTQLRLGQTFNTDYLNGHIKEIGYWPVYLPFPTLSSLIQY